MLRLLSQTAPFLLESLTNNHGHGSVDRSVRPLGRGGRDEGSGTADWAGVQAHTDFLGWRLEPELFCTFDALAHFSNLAPPSCLPGPLVRHPNCDLDFEPSRPAVYRIRRVAKVLSQIWRDFGRRCLSRSEGQTGPFHIRTALILDSGCLGENLEGALWDVRLRMGDNNLEKDHVGLTVNRDFARREIG